MKRLAPITGYRFNLKTGHNLTFVSSDTGSVFQISTTTPTKKRNPGVRREIYLKRNTAAILAAVLMETLGCTNTDELVKMIDYDKVITP